MKFVRVQDKDLEGWHRIEAAQYVRGRTDPHWLTKCGHALDGTNAPNAIERDLPGALDKFCRRCILPGPREEKLVAEVLDRARAMSPRRLPARKTKRKVVKTVTPPDDRLMTLL